MDTSDVKPDTSGGFPHCTQPDPYRFYNRLLAGWARGQERRGWEGGTELVEGILPLLHAPSDGGDRGELRPLRQASCGVQALLGLQASLLLRGCMPERKLEAPQEGMRTAGASAGHSCEN